MRIATRVILASVFSALCFGASPALAAGSFPVTPNMVGCCR